MWRRTEVLTVNSYLEHLSATGAGAGWRNGDFDHDGRVGPRDLLLLRENYGVRMPAGAASAGVSLVPEPGAATTGAPLATFVLLLRRRRRHAIA